jgi:hypothetical protein
MELVNQIEEERMNITKKELEGYLKYLEQNKREFPLCVGQEFMIEIVKMAIDSFDN